MADAFYTRTFAGAEQLTAYINTVVGGAALTKGDIVKIKRVGITWYLLFWWDTVAHGGAAPPTGMGIKDADGT